jgi:hypothetical protein
MRPASLRKGENCPLISRKEALPVGDQTLEVDTGSGHSRSVLNFGGGLQRAFATDIRNDIPSEGLIKWITLEMIESLASRSHATLLSAIYRPMCNAQSILIHFVLALSMLNRQTD